ncbi:hypothetical protein [Peribacillus aracenensis]|uniref:hypothetical protein n=1 Tax=Peribacillus aracenensis TaxID=2976708 RepID=UPI0021A830D8|nr:hypothetical protein [Peribacillus sp. BBB004]
MQLANQRLYKQPNIENICALGKQEDYMFQALAYMGNASFQMAWANTVISNDNKVSEELKLEMKQINKNIQDIQKKLRDL